MNSRPLMAAAVATLRGRRRRRRHASGRRGLSDIKGSRSIWNEILHHKKVLYMRNPLKERNLEIIRKSFRKSYQEIISGNHIRNTRASRAGPEPHSKAPGKAREIGRGGCATPVLHPVHIARIHYPRFVPRVGLPRNLCLIGSLTAALRFVPRVGYDKTRLLDCELGV